MRMQLHMKRVRLFAAVVLAAAMLLVSAAPLWHHHDSGGHGDHSGHGGHGDPASCAVCYAVAAAALADLPRGEAGGWVCTAMDVVLIPAEGDRGVRAQALARARGPPRSRELN